MPDDLQRDVPAARRRVRRFVVRDADDHRATAKIEEFLSRGGPRARGRTGARPSRASGRVDTSFDTRPDFAAALAREAARTERYGHPATVLAVEFEVASPGGKGTAPATSDGERARQIDRLAGSIGFTLRREARDTDLIARVAPNRFHVLLPETSEADASRFIDRARRACEVWFAGRMLRDPP
jgi:hypothetical protein